MKDSTLGSSATLDFSSAHTLSVALCGDPLLNPITESFTVPLSLSALYVSSTCVLCCCAQTHAKNVAKFKNKSISFYFAKTNMTNNVVCLKALIFDVF